MSLGTDMLPLNPHRTDDAASGDAAALGYVCLAALGFSLVPVVLDVSVSQASALTVGAGITIGYLLCHELQLRLIRPSGLAPHRLLWQTIRNDKSFPVPAPLLIAVMCVSALSYLFLAMAINYIDAAVAAVMFEFWPLVFFVTMLYVDRRRLEQRPREPATARTWCLLLLGAVAVVPVMLSSHDPSGESSAWLLGICLALLAPLATGMHPLVFLPVDRIMFSKVPQEASGPDSHAPKTRLRTEETLATATHVSMRLIVLPVAVAAAMIQQGGISDFLTWGFAGGICAGLLCSGPASIFNRKALIVSSNRKILSVFYFTPALSLGWLAAFRSVDIPRPWLLALGCSILITVNILVNRNTGRTSIRPPTMTVLRNG